MRINRKPVANHDMDLFDDHNGALDDEIDVVRNISLRYDMRSSREDKEQQQTWWKM